MLILPKPPLKTATKQVIQSASFDTESTLFSTFTPNPGGQSEFFSYLPIDSRADVEARWVAAIGGIGGGKSWVGAVWFCSRCLLFPDSRGLITANDYPQLETSTLVTLAEVCEYYKIPLWPKGEDADETAKMIANRRLCKIGKCSVLVISANKFGGTTKKAKQSGRGLQVKFIWADEFAYADLSAFETINGRLGRGKGELSGIGVITTTPNRLVPFNWLYDYFDNPERDENKQRLYKAFHILTRENVANLGESYVGGLEASYTPELAAIELEGKFARITTGLAYKYFSRADHVLLSGVEYSPHEEVHLSFDFNVNPMTAIAARKLKEGIVVLREWRLEDSDTFEMSKQVFDWLKLAGHQAKVYIHGDASGNNRSTNSRLTNWAIIWQAIRERGLNGVKCYGSKNPAVLDTVLSVNSLFRQDRLFVIGVPYLVKDLEQVAWTADGKELDKKTDASLTHLSDCLRYLVWDLFPYRAEQPTQKQQKPVGGVY